MGELEDRLRQVQAEKERYLAEQARLRDQAEARVGAMIGEFVALCRANRIASHPVYDHDPDSPSCGPFRMRDRILGHGWLFSMCHNGSDADHALAALDDKSLIRAYGHSDFLKTRKGILSASPFIPPRNAIGIYHRIGYATLAAAYGVGTDFEILQSRLISIVQGY